MAHLICDDLVITAGRQHLHRAYAFLEWHGWQRMNTALVHEQGNRDVATVHPNQAYAGFTPLPVPKYIERTERLARDYSVTLTAAEMEPTESVEELT